MTLRGLHTYRGGRLIPLEDGFVPPPPPPTPFSGFDYSPNSAFNDSTRVFKNGKAFTAEASLLYDGVLWNAANNPVAPNNQSRTSPLVAKDSYNIARMTWPLTQSLIVCYRLTGDLRLLDGIAQVAQVFLNNLAIGWVASYTSDGGASWPASGASPFRTYTQKGGNEGNAISGTDRNTQNDTKIGTLAMEMYLPLNAARGLASPGGYNYGNLADQLKTWLDDEWVPRWRNEAKGGQTNTSHGNTSGWRDSYRGWRNYEADPTVPPGSSFTRPAGNETILGVANGMHEGMSWLHICHLLGQMRPTEVNADGKSWHDRRDWFWAKWLLNNYRESGAPGEEEAYWAHYWRPWESNTSRYWANLGTYTGYVQQVLFWHSLDGVPALTAVRMERIGRNMANRLILSPAVTVNLSSGSTITAYIARDINGNVQPTDTIARPDASASSGTSWTPQVLSKAISDSYGLLIPWMSSAKATAMRGWMTTSTGGGIATPKALAIHAGLLLREALTA
jgi:hypothetical protein